MGKRTPLYDSHVAMGGKMVDFGGWDMPLHYGSQVEEHHLVRQHAGMFDVSHMTVVDYEGAGTRDFLRYLLANDIDKLSKSGQPEGKALYSAMLNPEGGVIDDLITYYVSESRYRMVVNAATRDKDLAWINQQAANFDCTVTERPELAMIAIQGPEARDKVHSVLSDAASAKAQALKPFSGVFDGDWYIARTGYTGEDGYEIMIPEAQAPAFMASLAEAGVKPAGLGARDTLRLEAGMNLYGSDMDETTSPWETGLGWTIALEPADRDFIGRDALVKAKQAGPKMKRVGLVLEGRGVLRNHQKVVTANGGEGEITSGGFSPTMGKGFAMARVPRDIGERCQVEVRGRLLDCRVVLPPFVKNGEPAV